MFGVDGKNLAFESAIQQVLKQRTADGGGTAGCADDGDGRWSEYEV
jgi:hypothetical protein